VTFYECDRPWYASNRDLPNADYCEVVLYDDLKTLAKVMEDPIEADVVIIGSYMPDGIRLAQWVLPRVRGLTAFYDIDTPVTLAGLHQGDCAYLTPALVPEFDLYLSFSGGESLRQLEQLYGARSARPLYCSVDCEEYFPENTPTRFDLGYLGTYSIDRQPKVETLLNHPARQWPEGRFCVAGPMYPADIQWPPNVMRVEHLPPQQHRRFYNEQRFTLNVTRQDMVQSGHSPSVRLFEAGACGVPVISDEWRGLDEFFTPGEEILLARSCDDVLRYLRDIAPNEAQAIGARARARVLAQHSSAHRAMELESYVAELTAAATAPMATASEPYILSLR
jgi:spore maturation protein CgeB